MDMPFERKPIVTQPDAELPHAACLHTLVSVKRAA